MSFPIVWDIMQNNAGNWYWRHFINDGTYEDSPKTFPTKIECIRDAKRNGFKLNISDFDLYQGNHD